MQENIRQRVALVGDALDLERRERIVPISALKNWNIFSLLTAMVEAAGSMKGASLLKAVHPDESGSEGAGAASSGAATAGRFGISRSLRDHFRAVIA